MATDLFEYDLKKLNILCQRGAELFAKAEAELQKSSCREGMGISEDQLAIWANQGPSKQFTATYETFGIA